VKIAMPEKSGQDFNDVLKVDGVKAVKQQLSQAKSITKFKQSLQQQQHIPPKQPSTQQTSLIKQQRQSEIEH